MFHPQKLLFLAALFLLTLAAIAQQQPSTQTVKVDIDLVLVNVSVANSDNEVVTNLQQENFQIFEDRIEQEIRYFATETTPISLGIIFDSSHSMEGKIDFARNAVVSFLENGTPDDEYFLVEFNSRARVAEDFTSDILKLRNRLILVPPDGKTAMYDALYIGLNKVKKGRNTKKALLLITDGEDNHSRYSRGDIHAYLRESDVQIYSIDMGRALISELSKITGGHSFRASPKEIAEICEKIAAELKNQYVIGYTPTNTASDGQWRKLRVRVNPTAGAERFHVRAKEGYYARKQ
jgi:Ca-activated chloride channel family protein